MYQPGSESKAFLTPVHILENLNINQLLDMHHYQIDMRSLIVKISLLVCHICVDRVGCPSKTFSLVGKKKDQEITHYSLKDGVRF